MPVESEWKTRKDRIDIRLTSLSQKWNLVRYYEGLDTSSLICHAVEEYPTANGPADYALFVKGRLLGIIEAKKVSVNPQNVLEQAKRYSKGAFTGPGNWNGYRVPFLYATNGEIIYFVDVREPEHHSRTLSTFHTSLALEELFQRNTAEAHYWLTTTPVQLDRLWNYQKKAIEEVESAICRNKREMLIAMATGTGKTFTTVALLYRLLESKLVRRILFLVDRKALAAQAVRALASFNTPRGNKFDQEYEVYSQRFRREDFGEEEPYNPKTLPEQYLTDPRSVHTFVYVSTIQRMTINLFGHEGTYSEGCVLDDDSDTSKLDIPVHAFDLIIADECHRGYTARETSKWREVISYFDAVKIGLTATPASHSLALFKEVVYRYSTDEAIADGYLVDYDAVSISSEVKLNGTFLKEGEHVGLVDTETGKITYDQLEDEREFSTTEIEEKVTIPDSNKKIIHEYAKYALRHEEVTGRFPKTLIFAVNDIPHVSHADQLVTICRDEFNRGDEFVQKITGNQNVDRPLQRIREFRNRPNPKIVVTVDMLSTGVDIPCIECIIFIRPVKSRILWVQMLGRGTRLCPEIHKTHFTIFDCFGGSLIEYFRDTTDFNIAPPQKEAVTLEQVIENIYKNVDRDYYTRVLVKRLRRIEKSMSGEAREKFAPYINDGDMGKFVEELPHRIKNDFIKTMSLLRDKDFQDLLLNYARAPRAFVIGFDAIDTVSSSTVMHIGGRYLKPEDYLDSFERFISENADHMEALNILLKKPKEWGTKTLNDLQLKLAQNKFPEKELQKVHKIVYGKELADIISMVRHAAQKEEPIYSATERVDKALKKITEGKTFDEEQHKWLELIREHLVQNLTIEADDFEMMPIFARAGGIGKAQKVFRERLGTLLSEINEAVAS